MDRIGARFGLLFPLINTHYLRMMVMWRSAFDGDLEKVMIVSAVIDQGMKASGFAEQSYESYLGSFIFENQAPPTNVQSIADFTGIPRETVRRKVNDLCAKGWLDRDKDGAVRLAIQGALDLAPQLREMARQLEKLSAAISDALRNGDFRQAV
ncbi:MAG: hypothetical protein KJS97_06600 [Alphaproteobacteria bacterium]|nr:hypothetical protein [Alphaproteobacteria bacterium]